MLLLKWPFVLGLLFFASFTQAHEMSIAEMTIRQINSNEYVWAWGIPGRDRPINQDLSVTWPEGCLADDKILRCGNRGLSGNISIRGLGDAYSAVLITLSASIFSKPFVYTLTSSHPSAKVDATVPDDRGAFEVAYSYTGLGFEHISTGIDHLFFVIGLLLLVGYSYNLLWTITAFTAAHSITLAASALGLLQLRPPPVEAAIALSIVLLCAEAISDRTTLTKTWPAVVTFIFGLIHGLGFAGALREFGLPQNHIIMALVGFNLGVEIGQLIVIFILFLPYFILKTNEHAFFLKRGAIYFIGSVAAYWSISRISGLFVM